MIEDCFDPLEWGIDALTAREMGRFDARGRRRVSAGRVGEVWAPRAVSDRVPDIERIALGCDNGGWDWQTRPPHLAFRHVQPVSYPGLNAWTTADDAAFAERWTTDLDVAVDEFIVAYQSAWYLALAETKPEFNAVARFVQELIDSGTIEPEQRKGYTREQLLAYKQHSALRAGPFNITVLRRTWEFPTIRNCVCCGAEHYFDLVPHYLIRTFGRPGVCVPCMHGARYGEMNGGPFTRIQILAALREFADVTRKAPTAMRFRDSLLMEDLDDTERGIAVALLLTIPTSKEVLQITQCTSWAEVLKAAGIEKKKTRRQSKSTAESDDDLPASLLHGTSRGQQRSIDAQSEPLHASAPPVAEGQDPQSNSVEQQDHGDDGANVFRIATRVGEDEEPTTIAAIKVSEVDSANLELHLLDDESGAAPPVKLYWRVGRKRLLKADFDHSELGPGEATVTIRPASFPDEETNDGDGAAVDESEAVGLDDNIIDANIALDDEPEFVILLLNADYIPIEGLCPNWYDGVVTVDVPIAFEDLATESWEMRITLRPRDEPSTNDYDDHETLVYDDYGYTEYM